MNETLQGATNRAYNAWKCLKTPENLVIGIGLESGLLEMPTLNDPSIPNEVLKMPESKKKKYFNVCSCAIYDGTKFSLGMGPAFELPPIVSERITDNDSLELAHVFDDLLKDKGGFVKSEGAIGYLTRSSTNRKNQLKQALLMAIQQLDNNELYQ